MGEGAVEENGAFSRGWFQLMKEETLKLLNFVLFAFAIPHTIIQSTTLET